MTFLPRFGTFEKTILERLHRSIALPDPPMRALSAIPLLIAAAVAGQMSHAQPRDPLRIYADFARFRGEQSSAFVEVYYAIPQTGLRFARDSAGFKATVDVTMIVYEADSLVHAERWLVPHTTSDTAGINPGMSLVGLTSVGLKQGQYTLTLVARDRNAPGSIDSVRLRLPVRALRTEKVELSDVELASAVRKGRQGSMFFKNTLEVVPNVQGLFSADQTCQVYAEAYNLLSPDPAATLTLRTAVFDAVGREIISRDKTKKRATESSVIVEAIPVDRLRTGTYSVILSLLDSSLTPVARTGKKFFVYNAALGVDSSLLNLSDRVLVNQFAGMDSLSLEQEWRWVTYDVMDAERAQYGALTSLDAKRRFMADFWARREPGKRDMYMQRVAETNRQFSAFKKEGYRTDRGRVFIIYGPPDDVERHPNEAEARPYDIWSYHGLQGGVIFVFVQRSTGGDYELVHSTHRNEIHDENWEQYARAR